MQLIENVSVSNNSLEDVTGMLTYCDCKFMQFLEGSQIQVEGIFSKIKKDIRHHSIDILRNGFIAERQFSDWHMKYIDVSKIHTTHGVVSNKINDIQTYSQKALDKAKESITLLTAFKLSCNDKMYTKSTRH